MENSQADRYNNFEKNYEKIRNADNNITWLNETRAQAKEAFLSGGYPSRREEAWKYTSIKNLRFHKDLAEDHPQRRAVSRNAQQLRDDRKIEIYLTDGALEKGLSFDHQTRNGMVVLPMKQAFEDHPDKVQMVLSKSRSLFNDSFTSMNEALIDDGVFIYLREGCEVEQSIHLHHFCEKQNHSATPRILIFQEKNSAACIVEHFHNQKPHQPEENVALSCPVTDIFLEPEASLDYARIICSKTPMDQAVLAYTRVNIAKNARFESTMVSSAGPLIRNSLHAKLSGDNARASLIGLSFSAEKEQMDHHVRVSHDASNTYSRQLYGTLTGKSAKTVFNGIIEVPEKVSKIDADQLNQNLLLDRNSEVYAKPQLEIDSSDVKCAHGSSIGQLNEKEVFYLTSRGIAKKKAEAMLAEGFLVKVQQDIENPTVAECVMECIKQIFPSQTKTQIESKG